MTLPNDATVELRQIFYRIMIAVAIGICIAKIVSAENLFEPSRYQPAAENSYGADREKEAIPTRVWPNVRPEPSPMFSSNDKSRWATVRALVENGSYVIAKRENFRDANPPFQDSGVIVGRTGKLESLDIVMNPETGEFYSSKPPLFATVLASGYAVLYHVFGLSLDQQRWQVVIVLLLIVNVAPFAIYLVLLARLVEGTGTTDFGRMFAFATACCGTYLTTFSMTLNNHTPAACAVLFALYLLMRKRPVGETETPGELFWSGLFAGVAITFELPSAAFAAGLFLPLLIVQPRKTLKYFLPGLLLPIAAFFAANYAALGRFRPAYSEFGGPWYEYGGSHWSRLKETPRPRGIDFNNEPTPVYAFHMLFGHHGWFSLTPVWLIGLIGLVRSQKGVTQEVRQLKGVCNQPVWTPKLMMSLTLVVSLVVFVFYLTRTSSYNYGGFTSGLRWLFWLTPLWVLATLQGADWIANRKRFGQSFALILLTVSVVSVFYPAANPWRHPWILQLCEYYGWVRY